MFLKGFKYKSFKKRNFFLKPKRSFSSFTTPGFSLAEQRVPKKGAHSYVWMYHHQDQSTLLQAELRKTFKTEPNWWFQIPPKFKRTEKMTLYRGSGRFNVTQGFFLTRHREELNDTIMAWASQVIPNPIKLQGPSPKKMSEDLANLLAQKLIDPSGICIPWRLHMISSSSTSIYPSHTGRGSLYYDLMEQLRKNNQSNLILSLTTAFKEHSKKGGVGISRVQEKREGRIQLSERSRWLLSLPHQKNEAIVQIIFSSVRNPQDMHAFASISLPNQVRALAKILSPFPGDSIHLPLIQGFIPSSASSKLLEAMVRLGEAPTTETRVIDLGCSPGGWSSVLLQLGARVIGVDKSEPDSAVLTHPNFSFIVGDVFSFQFTQETPEWVVCDVLTTPDRVKELIEHWIFHRKPAFFVFTIKFKKSTIDLEEIKDFLAQHHHPDCFYNLKKFLHNTSNEVTLFGSWRKEIIK